MKIYNQKGVIWGVIWTILGIWTFILDMIKPNDFLPLQIKHIVLSIALIAIGISGFIRAFSKKATLEDMIEDRDERNRLVVLKSKAKTLDILFCILTVFMIGSVIGYKITTNMTWGFNIAVMVLIIGISWITYFVVLWHYEKHE